MMLHRIINRKSILLLSLVLIFTMAVGSTLAILVSQSPTLLNKFVSGLSPVGNLTITKTLDHPYGSGYVIPDSAQYEFEVDLGNYTDPTVETDMGTVDVVDGVVTLTLKPGESVTIYDIDEGTQVTVTESPLGLGYTQPDTQSVRIVADDTVSVDFVNVYRPVEVDAGDLTVRGEKLLDGRDWQEGDTFTFQIEWKQNGDWSVLGTQTVTYDPENPDFNKFDFTEMVQTAVQEMRYDENGILMDTYQFKISEAEAGSTIGGVTYDRNESYFDVKVADSDLDGKLEIVSVSSNSDNTAVDGCDVYVVFRNAYAPEGSVEVLINIIKILEDLSGQNKLPEGFQFKLYDADGQEVKATERTSTSGETAIKLVYTPDVLGGNAEAVFDYTLKEVNDGQTGMIYDETVYRIRVRVTDNLDGTICAVVYLVTGEEQEIPADASDSCTVTFRNTYDPDDAGCEIGGEKHLTGRDLVAGEFRFHLFATGDSFCIPRGAEPVQTVSNDANGNFSFETLTFDKVGTYRYVVVEDLSNPLGGVIYDTAVYHVTVTVTDEDGVLVARTLITDPCGNQVELRFCNSYVAKPASVVIGGQKILHGGSLMCGNFQFALYQADEQFNPQGQPIQQVSNLASGAILFEPLTFTEPGSYYYVVVEDSSNPVDRVTYDDSVYGITVVVADNGLGQLEAYYTIVNIGTGTVDAIVFENTYHPKPCDAVVCIPVQKIILNLGQEWIGPDGFRFVLENLDTGERTIVESNLLGDAAFWLNFTEKDVGKTYHYQITELNDGREDVTYSTLVYSFRITVKLGPDGQIIALMEMGGVPIVGFVAVFENIYDDGQEPTCPIDPSCPTDPSDPSAPGESTDPSNPSTPGESTDPSDPSAPGESTEPSDPSGPSESTEPGGPIASGDPDDPTDVGDSDQTTAPAKPGDGEDPSTGDRNDIILYVVMSVVGIAILVLLLATAKWNWKGKVSRS